MALLANQRLRINQNKVTFLHRQLLGKGQITAKVGQEVTPSDILGKTSIAAGFRVINLASELEVSPSEVRKYLKRNIGQIIYKGELLAFKKAGLFTPQKIITAPSDVSIISLNEKTGDLHLSFIPKIEELPSAVFGVIEKIDEQRNEIIIRTQVTEIFGVFGSGMLREGNLRLLGKGTDLVDETRINSQWDGQIIVGGALIYGSALTKAVSLGVHGIITGGINATDYRSMSGGKIQFPNSFGSEIGMALLVTEGFGTAIIGEDIFQVLTKFNDKFAILDGNKGVLMLPSCDSDCMVKIRTTSLPTNLVNQVESLNLEAAEIEMGKRVRIIRGALGEQGKVVSIDKLPTLLPSGVRTILLTIETRSRKLKVPYSNVEII